MKDLSNRLSKLKEDFCLKQKLISTFVIDISSIYSSLDILLHGGILPGIAKDITSPQHFCTLENVAFLPVFGPDRSILLWHL